MSSYLKGLMQIGVGLLYCRYAAICLVYLLFISATGCNSQPVTVEEEISEANARLLAIRDAYSLFDEKSGRPPRNEKELLRFLQSEEPEETLISPRDGKPFVVCYGVDVYDAEWAKPDSTPIVAYEQQGEAGKRWVLAPPGMVFEIEEQEFSKASFPPGHKVQE